jgi:hypothetical protein
MKGLATILAMSRFSTMLIKKLVYFYARNDDLFYHAKKDLIAPLLLNK